MWLCNEILFLWFFFPCGWRFQKTHPFLLWSPDRYASCYSKYLSLSRSRSGKTSFTPAFIWAEHLVPFWPLENWLFNRDLFSSWISVVKPSAGAQPTSSGVQWSEVLIFHCFLYFFFIELKHEGANGLIWYLIMKSVLLQSLFIFSPGVAVGYMLSL